MSGADERMVAIAHAGLEGAPSVAALDGLFLRADGAARGGAVIAPPHPLHGGSMDNPVVSELAFACARAGLASLRFDWRGVGASAGRASGELADGAADYAAALAHLADTTEGPLTLCGYSFGAAAAAAQVGRAGPLVARVRRLVLVAPPPGLLDGEALARFRGAVLFVTGERDAIAPAARLAELADGLPQGQLAVLAHADHFFGVGLGELGRVTLLWLEGEARVRG